MYFPVKSSGLIRRTVGHVQAVDGVSFEVPDRWRPGPGRRVRLRQVDHRAADHPAADPDGGGDPLRGRRHRQALAAPAQAAASRHPDDLPGPVHVAEPAAHGRLDRRCAAGDPQHRPEEADPAPGAGAARDRRAQPGALQPLPERVLRRPAPAHRHRPRADPEPQAAGRRRAGLRARRVDPGAGDQPAAGPAEASSASPSCSSPTTSRWCGTSAPRSR